MVARLRAHHQELAKAKIRASQLVNVIQNHALGIKLVERDSQLNAAVSLLRKILPDLQTAVIDMDVKHHAPTGAALLSEIAAIQARLCLTPSPLERDITPPPAMLPSVGDDTELPQADSDTGDR